MNSKWLNSLALVAVALAVTLVTVGNWNRDQSRRNPNVSLNGTLQPDRETNKKFISKYQDYRGGTLTAQQSGGASSTQDQIATGGLKAAVVRPAKGSEIDPSHAQALIPANSSKHLEPDSRSYSSTIVFVVHKGNPKRIADWSDLVKTDVSVLTADPHIYGNGRLAMMAAWSSVVYRGGDEAQASHFVGELRKHLLLLDVGENEISRKFAQEKLGDVHLTWENDALIECEEGGDALQIVYPPVSIRAELPVAWADADVAGTRFRASNIAVLNKLSDRHPDLNLFPVSLVAKRGEQVQVARK